VFFFMSGLGHAVIFYSWTCSWRDMLTLFSFGRCWAWSPCGRTASGDLGAMANDKLGTIANGELGREEGTGCFVYLQPPGRFVVCQRSGRV
jgi:hypothetical protein